ncbi:alginate export family protein [Bizionia sediminis]|uniref:Alginate export family protein n=1 Tax=Bizionia sediminis TaxID=1737064 RepID=A0ABW5KPU8_9FLAO
MKKTLIILLIGLFSQHFMAQSLEIGAEIRPRLEYRHGYKTLKVDSLNAAAFVSQRTRLNFTYNSEKMNAYLSVQDVRVWGDVATLNASDKNAPAVHEAWAELLLAPAWRLKLGRQEISLDNQRIFGAVGWAQQARSHDALLASYKPNEFHEITLGLALNATAETLFETDYTLNNYKAMQYLWYHAQLNPLKLSFLVLNNGLAYMENNKQEVAYNQTFGTHARYRKNNFQADGSVYFQTGKLDTASLNAFNVALNASYKFTNGLKTGLGAEYLSGTDMNTTSTTVKSFNPWYGTNHKFNGFMDYFYVGNHINSVGLIDVYASVAYAKNKFSMAVTPHVFNAAAAVINSQNQEMDAYLGTELDVTFNYKWTPDVTFQAGYSHMFASETMGILKGGNANATNNWAWLMVTINPRIFKTTL